MSRVLLASLAFASIVASGAVGACYKTPSPECAFACELGGDETCPDGYTCRADNLCKREGVADSFVCPDTDTDVDAAPAIDAAEADAPETDAASIDAAQIDAAQIDAAQIDAAIDAPDIDADTTDADMTDADETDAPPDAT